VRSGHAGARDLSHDILGAPGICKLDDQNGRVRSGFSGRANVTRRAVGAGVEMAKQVMVRKRKRRQGEDVRNRSGSQQKAPPAAEQPRRQGHGLIILGQARLRGCPGNGSLAVDGAT
jgi:hypothetical protein